MKNNILNDAMFMGKVIAGVSHDVQNVLAIIRETAGLLEDILLVNKDADIPSLDRFQNSLKAIGEQTERGARLISTLNLFAHSPDIPVCDTDIQKSIETLLLLIHRKIESKDITIKLNKKDNPVVLRTDCVKFQAAIFLCIESLLTHLKTKDTVSISAEKIENAVKIHFLWPDEFLDENTLKNSTTYLELEKLCSKINGKILAENKTNCIGLEFSSLSLD